MFMKGVSSFGEGEMSWISVDVFLSHHFSMYREHDDLDNEISAVVPSGRSREGSAGTLSFSPLRQRQPAMYVTRSGAPNL